MSRGRACSHAQVKDSGQITLNSGRFKGPMLLGALQACLEAVGMKITTTDVDRWNVVVGAALVRFQDGMVSVHSMHQRHWLRLRPCVQHVQPTSQWALLTCTLHKVCSCKHVLRAPGRSLKHTRAPRVTEQLTRCILQVIAPRGPDSAERAKQVLVRIGRSKACTLQRRTCGPERLAAAAAAVAPAEWLQWQSGGETGPCAHDCPAAQAASTGQIQSVLSLATTTAGGARGIAGGVARYIIVRVAVLIHISAGCQEQQFSVGRHTASDSGTAGIIKVATVHW